MSPERGIGQKHQLTGIKEDLSDVPLCVGLDRNNQIRPPITVQCMSPSVRGLDRYITLNISECQLHILYAIQSTYMKESCHID